MNLFCKKKNEKKRKIKEKFNPLTVICEFVIFFNFIKCE